MASTINFDNYIKRFCDTMRGVQRILFVGEGFDIRQYPALAAQAWKCIYTTNREAGFADAFSLADRQVRPIYTKKAYDAAGTKLDRKNPLCIYLKGCDAVDDDADDFDFVHDVVGIYKAINRIAHPVDFSNDPLFTPRFAGRRS